MHIGKVCSRCTRHRSNTIRHCTIRFKIVKCHTLLEPAQRPGNYQICIFSLFDDKVPFEIFLNGRRKSYVFRSEQLVQRTTLGSQLSLDPRNINSAFFTVQGSFSSRLDLGVMRRIRIVEDLEAQQLDYIVLILCYAVSNIT